MKKVNNYWVDENNNRWNCLFYTEEEAEEYSKTLNNCSNCKNCKSCKSCMNCMNCMNCSYCSYCSNCSVCVDCRSCSDCSCCYNCREFAVNPQRYVTPRIGSRDDNTTIYWLGDNVQVLCGCFRGNLEQWEEAINATHKDNEKHREDYLKQVRVVRKLIMESEKE